MVNTNKKLDEKYKEYLQLVKKGKRFTGDQDPKVLKLYNEKIAYQLAYNSDKNG